MNVIERIRQLLKLLPENIRVKRKYFLENTVAIVEDDGDLLFKKVYELVTKDAIVLSIAVDEKDNVTVSIRRLCSCH